MDRRVGRLTAGVAVLVLATGVATAVSPPRPSQTAVAATRPNIVVILTDDQRFDMVSRMPNLKALLADHGVTFTQAFVNDPLCCPSRITILRGQYAHTTRLYNVSGAFGGYPKVKKFGLQSSTLATWLHQSGYRAGLVGKYMNQYTPTHATQVPPGWDYWAALATTGTSAYYYGYKLSYSPTGTSPAAVRSYGSAPTDYSTRVFSRFARNFITTTPATKPLFLFYAPTAPHSPSTPDPRDTTASCSTNPQYPSFGEADVSDKPSWVQSEPWDATLQKRFLAKWLKQCRSLIAVDRSLGVLINTLQAEGRLSNTLFVYLSDNGLFDGEHRLDGKKAAYEEAIRVPFVVRYDPVIGAAGLAGTTDAHMILNVDVAPTALAVAGTSAASPIPCVSPCTPTPIEGQSFLPFLTGTSIPWRTDMLIEHYDDHGLSGYRPPYCGVRTNSGLKYVRYDPDEEPRYEELYDLVADPYELTNVAADPGYAAVRTTLRERLVQLCSPAPPGYGF